MDQAAPTSPEADPASSAPASPAAPAVASRPRGGLVGRVVLGLVALSLVGMVWVLAKSFGTDPRAVPFKMLGEKAPNFSMKRLDTGEMVHFSDYAGRPVILNFWATWCGPCKQEHPVLNWGAERFGDKVVFLGIVFEDTEANTTKFLKENGSTFLQLYDPTSTVAVDYAVAGVPETYFIDRNGIIQGKVAYPIDPQTLQSGVMELLR